MSIREKTPDKILITTDFLKSVVLEENNKKKVVNNLENSKNMSIALGGGLTSCLFSLGTSWNTLSDLLVKILLGVISIAFAFFTLWYVVKWIQSYKELKNIPTFDLEERILEEAKKKIRYTALLILDYQSPKTGEVKFMTERCGNYLIHCDMDPYKKIEEQKEGIINYLINSYDISKSHIVDVIPLSRTPFFSIKPIHGEEIQNGFVFFQIKLKKKSKSSLSNHRLVLWKSLREMESDPDLMGRNKDIVMALEEIKTKIVDTFENTYSPIHIIWNITKECAYDCAICATRDASRKELPTEKKLTVLNHIFSAKERIGILDFAGGDPMYESGIRTVILQAINSLGEEYVSVTTTGEGLQSISNESEEDICKLLRKCELTIDASHENLTTNLSESIFSRKSPKYCEHNYLQMKKASDNFKCLVINIPLLDDDLTDEEIQNLISKLLKLKQSFTEIEIEAQLIRLMPVGAFDNNYDIKAYATYNPLELAEKIKRRVEEIGISCRYHCSLRVLSKLGEADTRCNMLSKKIGIDCSGNVFACTWGAYLKIDDGDITKNPFYLGNLVSSSLKSILEENKTFAYKRISRDIYQGTYKPYCEAVSYFFKRTVEENNDPLS